MRKFSLFPQLAILGFFFALNVWGSKPANLEAFLDYCDRIFGEMDARRKFVRTQVKWNDPHDFLLAIKEQQKFARVKQVFDEELDTRIYYTEPGTMDPNNPSLVDPTAPALLVWMHGSGTSKSSGATGMGLMNDWASMGFASIAPDYPFHGDGPSAEGFYEPEFTMKWLNRLITKYRNPGQPVYFVGHSFGPDMIAEFLSRYPQAAEGGLLMNPAGFNPVLEDWYVKFTEKMKFGGDVPTNEAGGEWANRLGKSFQWNKPNAPENDPTLKNPNLKLRVLTGDMEEYVPAPVGGPNKTPVGKNTYDLCAAIKLLLRNANCVLEPGIGHYIFDHIDKNGMPAVQREVLTLLGKAPTKETVRVLKEEKGNKDKKTSPEQKLAILYETDPIFKTWVNAKGLGQRLVYNWKNGNQEAATAMLRDYETDYKARMAEIDIYLLEKAPKLYPSFLSENAKLYESLKDSKLKEGARLDIQETLRKKFTLFLETRNIK